MQKANKKKQLPNNLVSGSNIWTYKPCYKFSPKSRVSPHEMGTTCLEFQNPISDAISRIRFGPKSNNLLISSWDSNLRLYDVETSSVRVESPCEAGLIDCCFKNESIAFSAGSDCCIRMYDLDSGVHDTIGIHSDLVCCVEYSDHTGQLITAGWDRKLLSWDTRLKKAVNSFDSLEPVESVSVSGFNLMAAVASSVKIFDLRNLNKQECVTEFCNGVQVRCVRRIENSEGFVAGLVDGRVAVEYLNSSEKGYVFWSLPKSKEGLHYVVAVNDVASSPSVSGAFVTGNEKGYVVAWDAQSRKRLKQLSRCSNSTSSLSFNCGGALLAVASSHSYRAENEIKESPKIFIYETDDFFVGPSSVSSSKFNKVSGNIM